MNITPDQISASASRIEAHVRRTPLWVLPSAALGLPAGAPEFEIGLKLEHLQRSGSFKARGMFNRLLSNPIPAAGVIAAARRERLATLGTTVVVAGAGTLRAKSKRNRAHPTACC
jgi:threonine dehydratase